MSKSKISNFTPEQVQEIVNNSFTKKEVATKLGYSSDGGSVNKVLNEYFEKYNIDISCLIKPSRITYTRETVFCKDGTISQHSLVDWYKKEKIPYQCSICGQEPFWNNKPLIMILDHINGVHNDDRLENLRWVCPNCNYQLDTTGFKKIRVINATKPRKNAAKIKYCIDCNKQIDYEAIRCIDCEKQRRREESNCPSREQLKYRIRILPFTQIGKEFNVSDNAVRKWCKNYNLPYLKKEINNYTDFEWESI